MSYIRLTKIFRFEMAHLLYGYDGPCKNIHGHSYELQVQIGGWVLVNNNHPKDGMVMDFGDLKQIVQREIISLFDHAMVVSSHMPEELIQDLKNVSPKVVVLPYQPSSENLLDFISKKLQAALPTNIKLQKLLLKETDTSFAEWLSNEN